MTDDQASRSVSKIIAQAAVRLRRRFLCDFAAAAASAFSGSRGLVQ